MAKEDEVETTLEVPHEEVTGEVHVEKAVCSCLRPFDSLQDLSLLRLYVTNKSRLQSSFDDIDTIVPLAESKSKSYQGRMHLVRVRSRSDLQA